MHPTASIAQDRLRGRTEITSRFSLALDDWPGAIALREANPAEPWSDVDLDELRRFNAEAGAPKAVLEQIGRLSDPKTRVVITGQQAGIALGPLFTLYKALGAIVQARRIERERQVPCVACFWIAAEDHDFEEIRQVHWLGKSGERQTFRYDPQADVEAVSVGGIPVEPSLRELLDRLVDTTAETEFRPAVESWLGEALESAKDLESLFARLMTSLLGRHGLVLLTPRLLGFRRRAAQLFFHELERPGWFSSRVLEAGAELRSLGHAVPIHRLAEDLNFFFYEDGKRRRLIWDGKAVALRAGDRTVRTASPNELRKAVESDPRRISCNVVTRPLCQDLSLPTLAYIAGAGETAYFSQLREVYEGMKIPMPLVAPRPSIALADARTRRFLKKTGWSLEAFLAERPAHWQRELASSQDGGASMAAIGEARGSMDESLRRLRNALAGGDPSVLKALDRLAAAQEKGLAAVEQRTQNELANRGQSLLDPLRRLEDWMRPDGLAQERVYSVLSPLLVNYGFDAIDRLADWIDPRTHDLQIFEL